MEGKFRGNLAEDQLSKSHIEAERDRLKKEKERFLYTFETDVDADPPEDWRVEPHIKPEPKPEPEVKDKNWRYRGLAEDQLPRSYILAEKTRERKAKDRFSYTFETGIDADPPEDWIGPSKRNWGERMDQHYKNNILEGDINRMYYDRQKMREQGKEYNDTELVAAENRLAKGHVRAEQLGGGVIDGIGQGLQDFLVGCGRMAGGTGEFVQDLAVQTGLMTRPVFDRDDYVRFYAGAQLRAHPDYTETEAIIHGQIEKAGELALWLMPAGGVGKVGKFFATHKLTTRLWMGAKEALKWEAVLAGPEAIHKTIDKALEADEHYYRGSPLEGEATEMRDSYKKIASDYVWWAALGGALGLAGRLPMVKGPAKEAVAIKELMKAKNKELAAIKKLPSTEKLVKQKQEIITLIRNLKLKGEYLKITEPGIEKLSKESRETLSKIVKLPPSVEKLTEIIQKELPAIKEFPTVKGPTGEAVAIKELLKVEQKELNAIKKLPLTKERERAEKEILDTIKNIKRTEREERKRVTKLEIEELRKATPRERGKIMERARVERGKITRPVELKPDPWYTKFRQEVAAKFPTYSAYVERRFGPEGKRIFYTNVRKAWERAETKIANRQTILAKLVKPGWLGEMVTLSGVKMPRGHMLDIRMHQLVNEGRWFSYKDKTFEITEAIKVSNLEASYMAGALRILKQQGLELEKAFGTKFKKVEAYYPISRKGYEPPEEFIRTSKGIVWNEGFMKPRVKSDLPIITKNIQHAVNQSIRKAENKLVLKESTEQALKVLHRLKINPAERKMIEQQLKFNYGMRPHKEFTERAVRTLMRNLTVGYLGLNPFTAMKQIFSFPLAVVYVKPTYVMEGLLEFVCHKKTTTNFFKKHSSMINQRLTGGFNKEMVELRVDTTGRWFKRHPAKVREKMMGGIKFMDENAVVPIMNGAFKQAKDEIVAGKLSREVEKIIGRRMKEKGWTVDELAIEFADSVVTRTQPMFSPLDRSLLANSTWFMRSFTMFGSATNQLFSLLWRTSKEPELFRKAVGGIALNIGGVMAVDYFRDALYHRDKERTVETEVKKIGYGAANLVWFARDIASWIQYHRYGSHIQNPLSSWSDDTLNTMYHFYMGLAEGELNDHHAKMLVRNVLHMSGIPARTIERLWEESGMTKKAKWVVKDIPQPKKKASTWSFEENYKLLTGKEMEEK